VDDLSIVPTPVVQFAVERNPGSGGAMVTASHNPLPDNGVKFFSPSATFLNEAEGWRLWRIHDAGSFAAAGRPGRLSRDDRASERLFAAIGAAVDRDAIARRRFKVVADVCQGVGAVTTRRFLEGLGCAVETVNEAPMGRFSRNPEPLPEHLRALRRAVVGGGADIGFAQDPDGDRLAVVSETGAPLGEEMTVVLAASRVLAATPGPVVVNLSTTALVDEMARGFGAAVHRSRIGEVNVVETMRGIGSPIGGEGNGGVIWPAVHCARDSYVGMALILDLLARTGGTAGGLAARYPRFVMIKRKVALTAERRQRLFAALGRRYRKERTDRTDGFKIVRADGWMHVRPSGTEPVVRIIVEGKDGRTARRHLDEISAVVSGG